MSFILRIKDKDFRQTIHTKETKFKKLEPAFKQIGEYMIASIIKNFEAGGRPQRWKPLKLMTIVQRYGGVRKSFKKSWRKTGEVKRGFSEYAGKHKILIKSGKLMKSITYKAFKDHVEIGTNLVYAAIHQFGGAAGRRHRALIPARPYLLVQEEDKLRIQKFLKDHIESK